MATHHVDPVRAIRKLLDEARVGVWSFGEDMHLVDPDACARWLAVEDKIRCQLKFLAPTNGSHQAASR